MPDLTPTTDDILSEYPSSFKFRILVLGRSGVGKTSLIKQAFNIEQIHASYLKSGVCDITRN